MHAQSLLLHKLSGTVSEVAGSFIAFGWPGGGGGGGGGGCNFHIGLVGSHQK